MVNCISGIINVDTMYSALAGAEGKQTLWSTASLFLCKHSVFCPGKQTLWSTASLVFYINTVCSDLAGAEGKQTLWSTAFLGFFCKHSVFCPSRG